MPKRVAEDERLAPDGKTLLRNIHTPGGNKVGKQTYADTPNGKNQAWQFTLSPGAPSGDAAERRKDNNQSIGNARKKARKEQETGKRARLTLNARASGLGIGEDDGLIVGASYGFDDHDKAQHAFAKRVHRAEQPSEERDAQNAVRRASDQVHKYFRVSRRTFFVMSRPKSYKDAHFPTLLNCC